MMSFRKCKELGLESSRPKPSDETIHVDSIGHFHVVNVKGDGNCQFRYTNYFTFAIFDYF